MRWQDDSAASQLIALLLGAGIFSMGTVYLITASVDQSDQALSNDTGYEALSHSLAETLFGPGSNWFQGNEDETCVGDKENPAALNPDALGDLEQGAPSARFGLGEEACTERPLTGFVNSLSFAKIASMYQGNITADDNGVLDYEEALRALNLEDENLDFHIRSWPVLPDVAEILGSGHADPHMKVAYVGDYVKSDGGAPVVRLVEHTAGVVDSTDYATPWVNIKNNGTVPTVFEVKFTLKLSEGTVYITRHTPLLAADERHNVTVRLAKTNDWEWPNEGSQPGSIQLCTIILDPNGDVVNGNALPASTIQLYGMEDAPGYSSVTAFPPTSWSTPTTLNVDLLDDDDVNDAMCTTHDNLPLGGYFYGEATISGPGWTAPKYNDQNTDPVYDIGDFFPYSGELFTSDSSDDAQRDTDSDGHLILTNSRPDRTVVLLAQHTGSGTYTGPNPPSIVYPKEVAFVVNDVEGPVGDGHIDFTAVNMDAGVERNLVFTHADKLWFNISGETEVNAKVHYATYEGDGSQEKLSDWTMEIYRPNDTLFDSEALPDTKSSYESFDLTAVGANTAELWNDAHTSFLNNDTINVIVGPVDAFSESASPGDYEPEESTVIEAGFLDILTEQFDLGAYSATYHSDDLAYVASGDVFPDVKEVINNDLPSWLIDDKGTSSPGDDEATLEHYNEVVIGSNVDHQALTSSAWTSAIEDWVMAGGTLIVFGSTEQNVQWLQPLFHASIDTASGGLYTPDADHPVLNVPNDLDYEAYKRVSTWSFNSGEGDKFTHIIKEGPADADPDLLTVSDAGSFGLGRILLTGFEPYDLTADDSDCALPLDEDTTCESIFFFQNMLSQSYRELYLDFGPPIPEDSSVGVSSRVAIVRHPDIAEGVVVHLSIYAFAG